MSVERPALGSYSSRKRRRSQARAGAHVRTQVRTALGRARRLPGGDAAARDARHAAALFDLLERVVIPIYYDRDAAGIPRGWVARIKASLRTIAPRFCATRMVDEYVRKIYSTERGTTAM